ncbi:MAG: hypothetical protein ACI93R_003539 [Flavobacteriales bacterium]
MRLDLRDVIKQTIHKAVKNPQLNSFMIVQIVVAEQTTASEKLELQALIVAELKRLHERVLARYGLRPSEFSAWKAVHKS